MVFQLVLPVITSRGNRDMIVINKDRLNSRRAKFNPDNCPAFFNHFLNSFSIYAHLSFLLFYSNTAINYSAHNKHSRRASGNNACPAIPAGQAYSAD